jgi:hypothetical protein
LKGTAERWRESYVGLVGGIVLEVVGDVDGDVEVALDGLPLADDVARSLGREGLGLEHLQHRAKGRDGKAEDGEREEENDLHVDGGLRKGIDKSASRLRSLLGRSREWWKERARFAQTNERRAWPYLSPMEVRHVSNNLVRVVRQTEVDCTLRFLAPHT